MQDNDEWSKEEVFSRLPSAAKAAHSAALSGTAEAALPKLLYENDFMKNTSTTATLNIVLPLTLEGSVVRLEPIRREHAELFWEVAKNDLEDIFRWIPYSMKTREDFEQLVEKAFSEQERGESVVFATVEARNRARHRQHAFYEHRPHQSTG